MLGLTVMKPQMRINLLFIKEKHLWINYSIIKSLWILFPFSIKETLEITK